MNRKRIILVGFVLLLVMRLFGQRVDFLYDDNGNRTSKTITVEQLTSNENKSRLTDPKQLGTQSNQLARGLGVGSTVQTADAKREDYITCKYKPLTSQLTHIVCVMLSIYCPSALSSFS